MEIIVVVLYGNIIGVVPGEGVTEINATVATYYRGEPNIVVQELANDGITDITMIEDFLQYYGMTLYRDNFIVVINKDTDEVISKVDNSGKSVFIDKKFKTLTFDSQNDVNAYLKSLDL
jgi:hypothetical protein